MYDFLCFSNRTIHKNIADLFYYFMICIHFLSMHNLKISGERKNTIFFHFQQIKNIFQDVASDNQLSGVQK
ncbi:Uncharacterized protein dnm_072730 [Desulfonema magnum]|uniref:Uncharacterized protein n=1 Tax=Desulfonema magnum TaxID=45655 RepID=A0A975BU04_9BACT|nr:Uncharacterized protein dnm_072730 [Desulfonema magnum]